jgi:hypothetical protein
VARYRNRSKEQLGSINGGVGKMKIVWMTLLLVVATVSGIKADPAVFYTWAPWETDSLAAAWAIKRYVDPKAVFVSVARGSKIASGNTIDVPNSPYRRSARTTAFDAVIRIHRIESTCIERKVANISLLPQPMNRATTPSV